MNCQRTKTFSERTMTSTHRTKHTSGPAREITRRGKTIDARTKASARRTKEIAERRKESSALRRWTENPQIYLRTVADAGTALDNASATHWRNSLIAANPGRINFEY